MSITKHRWVLGPMVRQGSARQVSCMCTYSTENTQEIQEFLFTGEISVWNYARGFVEIICESIAAQKLASAVPGLFLPPMTTEGSPLTNSGTASEPARAVALGMGAAVALPGMLAKQQGNNNLDPPEWDYVFGRGNLGFSGISVNGTRSDDRTIWVYKARFISLVESTARRCVLGEALQRQRMGWREHCRR